MAVGSELGLPPWPTVGNSTGPVAMLCTLIFSRLQELLKNTRYLTCIPLKKSQCYMSVLMSTYTRRSKFWRGYLNSNSLTELPGSIMTEPKFLDKWNFYVVENNHMRRYVITVFFDVYWIIIQERWNLFWQIPFENQL